jgi:hypothetical protein
MALTNHDLRYKSFGDERLAEAAHLFDDLIDRWLRCRGDAEFQRGCREVVGSEDMEDDRLRLVPPRERGGVLERTPGPLRKIHRTEHASDVDHVILRFMKTAA